MELKKCRKNEERNLYPNEEYWGIIEDHASLCPLEEVEVVTLYLQGDAAAQIIQLAKREHFQLIIIGSRGLGGIQELILGSVSHKVIQLLRCRVLVVK